MKRFAIGMAAATMLAAPAVAAPVTWGGNGHSYEYIFNAVDWNQAVALAAASTYNGQQGYLVTVTSADEASFIYNNVGTGIAWAGGTDQGNEGTWSWVTGPEAGTVFWQNGVTQTYANWAGGEPNNCCGGENFLHIHWSGSGWNDIYASNWNYIIEYGGLGGAVPEPAAWALLILGFGMVGGALRRNRKVRTALTYA